MPNANLEQEIAKLKKELREIKQAHQKEKDAWNKIIVKIILWGTIASSISNIISLIIAIIHFFKR